MLKCKQPRGRKVADHPPKRPHTQWSLDGGRITYVIGYDKDDNDNDDDDDYNDDNFDDDKGDCYVFSSS